MTRTPIPKLVAEIARIIAERLLEDAKANGMDVAPDTLGNWTGLILELITEDAEADQDPSPHGLLDVTAAIDAPSPDLFDTGDRSLSHLDLFKR